MKRHWILTECLQIANVPDPLAISSNADACYPGELTTVLTLIEEQCSANRTLVLPFTRKALYRRSSPSREALTSLDGVLVRFKMRCRQIGYFFRPRAMIPNPNPTPIIPAIRTARRLGCGSLMELPPDKNCVSAAVVAIGGISLLAGMWPNLR